MSKERIVFMGTPDFAVESLRFLLREKKNVVGVVTSPDRAVGKHHSSLQPSPVKKAAIEAGLPVLQPDSLKDPDFIESLAGWKPDLQIVVAFRMLPDTVWKLPPMGTFNLHASLLPNYRGAAPINHAIMNGETETGVTTFFLTYGVDLGRIILRRSHPIAETDDAGTVHDALMIKGAQLVCETVDAIFSGKISTTDQADIHADETKIQYAPKIFTDTCRIDWALPIDRIYNHIRGLAPTPAAWTTLVFPDGSRPVLKIFQTEKIHATHGYKPGTILTEPKTGMKVAVDGGYIRPLLLQIAGKSRMSAQDFINGQRNLSEAVIE
jgi:methionyl-tRNA formyltransferase